MKLKRLEIENFRAIQKCSIRFHELTAIVGENNSGKTAILRALNSFFNFEDEKSDFENGMHRYAVKTTTKITVTFEEVSGRFDDELINSNNELRIQFVYSYGKTKAGRKLLSDINGTKKPLDSSIIDDIKKEIDFVYIPASRSNKDIEWQENSIFSKLIIRYLEDKTKNRDNLSQRVTMVGDRILDQTLNNLASDLTELNMYSDVGSYQITFNQTVDYRIFLDKLGLEILSKDESKCLPAREYGSGVKSLTVIALHRMLANLNHVSIILGIEELGTNLHPQAQRMLINSLKTSRQSCETQAIFATHSTVIVDALEHDDIVLVRRVKDPKRGFHSETAQISETFWQDHNIQEQKHYNFFKYRNSDFFFARFVILAESITDAQVIEHMLKRELANKMYYVSIVNLDGVKNIIYPFFLLNDLKIPFCAVVDKDFFTTYKNGKLDSSRNTTTYLPEYSGDITNNKVNNHLFPTENERDQLKYFLGQSYTMFFEYVKRFDLLPMAYCLEMDLISSNETDRQKYYDHYHLEDSKREIKSLLIDRKDAIKDPTVLIPIFQALEPKEYPHSFKKIRKELSDRIREL